MTPDDRAQADVPAAAAADPLDWQDVQASLGGDGEAYARLVGRYQAAMGAYMWRFTRDPAQCEELVQDVFVEAYLSLRSFRGRSAMLHWLRRIATRVGYRYWRRRARRRLEAPVPDYVWEGLAAADTPTAGAAQAAAAVHAVLARLAPRDRLVLTLMYLEDCSVAQTAALTGWSQTMVKVQAHRARQRLKKLLQPTETSP